MVSLELVKRNGQRQPTKLPFKANLGLIGKDGEIAYVRKADGGVTVEYHNGSRVFMTSRLLATIRSVMDEPDQ